MLAPVTNRESLAHGLSVKLEPSHGVCVLQWRNARRVGNLAAMQHLGAEYEYAASRPLGPIRVVGLRIRNVGRPLEQVLKAATAARARFDTVILHGWRLGSDEFRALVQCDNIEELVLLDCTIESSWPFKPLPHLRELSVHDSTGNMTNLARSLRPQRLDIDVRNVDEELIATFSGIKRVFVRAIGLQATQLNELTALPNVEMIDARECPLTQDEFNSLKQRFPHGRVVVPGR